MFMCVCVLMAQPRIDGPASWPTHTIATYNIAAAPTKSLALWQVSPVPPAAQLHPQAIRRAGKSCAVTAPPGQYLIMVALCNLESGEEIYLELPFNVHAGPNPGPVPPVPPVPGPNPGPAPQPVPVPSKFGLAEIVRTERAKLPPAAAARAADLAAKLAAAAGAFRGQVFPNYRQALDQAFAAGVGDQAAAWNPCKQAVMDRLTVLNQQKVVRTVAALADAIDEVAGALR